MNVDIKYLNLDLIKEYAKEIQGVRIEDMVIITENGCENLCEMLPRSCEEIEKCVKGETWN